MTSTMTRHSAQPPGSLSANGSVANGSVSDNTSETTPPSHVDLSVLLPDGRTRSITVEYGKQMMDLIVQVAASNKYSPAGYTIIATSEETGRPVHYQASQSIGSLGVAEVELISKKAEKERRSKPAIKPLPGFEKTQRLTVNLPRNQKFVTRVNYRDTLAAIYRMVCEEKNLDPYKYELRHPTRPDAQINMATPLEQYNIHEITVVSVSAQDARRATDYDVTDNSAVRTLRPSVTSSATSSDSMGRRKPEAEATPSYMPGMTEKKKKKGILGLFSKKKEGKFHLDGATYGESTTSNPPSASSTMTRSVSASVAPAHHHAGAHPAGASSTLPRSQSHTATIAGASSGAAAASVAPSKPNKPPRTKRRAPAPPPPPGAPAVGASQALTVSVTSDSQTKEHHSRNSSHSSGFDETNVSPLESPGNSSRESTKTQGSAKTKTSLDGSSIDSSDMVHRVSSVKADIPAPIAEATASTLKRKKRKAPAPPAPTGAVTRGDSMREEMEDRPFPSPPPPLEFSSEGAAADSQSEHSSADGNRTTSSSSSSGEGAERSNDRSASLSNGQSSEGMGSTDSLGRPRPPAQFHAPPPPSSPPPPETPVTALRSFHWAVNGKEVATSSVQVHAGNSSPPLQPVADARSPRHDVNVGLEDVTHLMDDAARRKQDGDSDTSSVTSDVINDVIMTHDGAGDRRHGSEQRSHDLSNEMALPSESEPALLSHKHSPPERAHVTTISVGGAGDAGYGIDRQDSIEKSRHASDADGVRSLHLDEEMVSEREEVRPRSRADSQRSRTLSSSSSIHSDGGFGPGNVMTDDDIRRFENDYRMPKFNKEEIVEFNFGTLDRNKKKLLTPQQKEEPKPATPPVTSLRSLRQAYTRTRPPPSTESGIAELDKKPLFVYTGEDVDKDEQAAMYDALRLSVPPTEPPKPSPPMSLDHRISMNGKHSHASSSDDEPEQETVLSPAEVLSPDIPEVRSLPEVAVRSLPKAEVSSPKIVSSPEAEIPSPEVFRSGPEREESFERSWQSERWDPDLGRWITEGSPGDGGGSAGEREGEPAEGEPEDLKAKPRIDLESSDSSSDEEAEIKQRNLPKKAEIKKNLPREVERTKEQLVKKDSRPREVERRKEQPREEFIIPREEVEAMRPRMGSAGAAKPASAQGGGSFVQSAAYRENPALSTRAPSGGSGGNAAKADHVVKRRSVYDLIKADISQRMGGTQHHVTDTYSGDVTEKRDDVTGDTAGHNKGEMDYLQYNRKSDRKSVVGSGDDQEVALPKQQFFFSSTSVADEYTPPTVRHEAKTHRPSKLLMGPRPWAAHRAEAPPSAGESNDKRDVIVTDNKRHPNDVTHTDFNSNYATRTTSSLHSDKTTVPQSPKRRPGGEVGGGARSELGFSPRPESESDSILEEKPISMIALPAVRNQSEAGGNSTGPRRAEEGEESGNQASHGDSGDSRTSLQNQYDKLQQQYQQWQGQLAENQALLSRRKILPTTAGTTAAQPGGGNTASEGTTGKPNRWSSYGDHVTRNVTSSTAQRRDVQSDVFGKNDVTTKSDIRVANRKPPYPERRSRFSTNSPTPSPTSTTAASSNASSSGSFTPAYSPGSFTLSSAKLRGAGSTTPTGYSNRYSDTGLRPVDPGMRPVDPGVYSRHSSGSVTGPTGSGDAVSSGTGRSTGSYGRPTSGYGRAASSSDSSSSSGYGGSAGMGGGWRNNTARNSTGAPNSSSALDGGGSSMDTRNGLHGSNTGLRANSAVNSTASRPSSTSSWRKSTDANSSSWRNSADAGNSRNSADASSTRGSTSSWRNSGRVGGVGQHEGKSVAPSGKVAHAHVSPPGRKSTASLVRQPMNKGRSFSSQSSNESTGSPNKPGIGDLLAAKSRLRKGSSEFATEMSEGVTAPEPPPVLLPTVASPPPPALPFTSPPKTPPNHGNLSFLDTPKEGSPDSSSAGGRLGVRGSTPKAPKPPPPPTAQPVKSSLKQPRRGHGGARADDPRFGPKLDPREELMIVIRNAGGRNALNKEEKE